MVGTEIAVEGSGFSPLSVVTIDFGWQEISTNPDEIQADADGDFSAEITVPEFTGAGIIEITADDGSDDDSAEFVVMNTPPVADTLPPVVLEQGTSELVSMTASDVNGDTLTIELVDNPSHGILSDFDSDTGEVSYTADEEYTGPDSFSFKVNDGMDDSDVSVVSITVTAASGSGPEGDTEVATLEDVPVTVPLEIEEDWDSVTFEIVSEPDHGTLGEIEYTGETSAEVEYEPDSDYSGTDTFVFSAEGDSGSVTMTVLISIEAVNDAPHAVPGYATVVENSKKKITLEASDMDGDDLSYTVISSPGHGNLTGSPSNLTYEPDNGYIGPDSFTFLASDSEYDSNIATFSITVAKGGSSGSYHYEESGQYTTRPVANPLTVSGTEDTPLEITLSATDPDGDSLRYSIAAYPSNGQIAGLDSLTGALLYMPDPEFSGDDSFTFLASDGYKESKEATVTISISPVNDPPQPHSMNLTATGGSAEVTLEASDAEEDALLFSIYSPPTHGTLDGNATSFVYTADSGFSGYDRFLFTVTDGRPDARIGVISIFVSSDDQDNDDVGDGGDAAEIPADQDQDDLPPLNEPVVQDPEDKSTTKARADKSRVMVMLSWDHKEVDKHVESTLNLQFAEHRTRDAFDSDVWYDLVMLDEANNEVFRRNDLVATNAQDTQNVTFPSDGTYHFEVNVKGLIDRSTNSISRNADYTGKALGIVVVPEFNPALVLGLTAATIGVMLVALRYRSGYRL